MKQTYTYTAFTPNSDGCVHTHTGTLVGAIRKAKQYARETFPQSNYKDYGPTVVVRDAAGEDVHRERM